MHWQSVGICQPLLLQTISGGAILPFQLPADRTGWKWDCGALESSLLNSFKTATLFILEAESSGGGKFDVNLIEINHFELQGFDSVEMGSRWNAPMKSNSI